MKHLKSKIRTEISKTEYNYLTLKITQSRIDKGLLAIPVSLIDIFPKNKQKIKVCFDDTQNYLELSFNPYTSSNRECRIGGLKGWFNLHQIKNNEELVIQVINKEESKYRIITEKR